MSEHARVYPISAVPDPPLGLEHAIEQMAHLALGLSALLIGAARQGLARARGAPEAPAEMPPLAGAALGLATEATRVVARALGTLERGLAPITPAVRAMSGGPIVDHFDRAWRQARPAIDERAAAVIREVTTAVVGAALNETDLSAMVARRIDPVRVVTQIDLESALRRIDVTELAQRVVDQVAPEAVASRIDIPQIARRVAEQIDVGTVARRVRDELDLPALFQQALPTAARLQGSTAETLGKVVDRVKRWTTEQRRP